MDNKLTFPFIFNYRVFENLLAERLTAIFANDLQLSDQQLHVKISPPSTEHVLQCMKTNRTLMAELVVSRGGEGQAISFSFPYPHYGVFVFRSENSKDGQAGKWIWHPRLIGKPGIWVLNKYKNNQSTDEKKIPTTRIVFPNGSYFDVGSANSASHKQLINLLILKSYGQYIDGNSPELLTVLDGYAGDLWAKIREPGIALSGIEKYIKKEPLEEKLISVFDQIRPENIQIIDEQDIGWQRLNTFSAFLLNQIISSFIEKKSKFFLKQKKLKLEGADLASSLWASLCELDGKNLISFKLKSDLLGRGQFHYFNPANGIDALSRLTSFQRYNYPAEVLERLPAGYRQNHPSYRGLVCPVDSPESKRVGLTLHLARGVRTDILGRLHSIAEDDEPDKGLGYGASLVPFYQHNDGPRAMMGAKNLKQAVPVKGADDPVIKTGNESDAAETIAPLADCGLIPACSRVAPGVDLLVAYMPWYGWNMEDAIVAGSRLVDEGVLDWESEEVFFKYIQPGFKLAKPEFENTFEEAFKILRYSDDNLHKTGINIGPEMPVAFFRNPSTGEKQPVLCGGDEPGELISIQYKAPGPQFLGGALTWTVRRTFPLMVGDKLMGRYGNKGVIAKNLPPNEMPRFPDDVRLPEDLRGRSVDLILNPHGVISRMNLGQLLETQVGLLHRLSPGSYKVPENIGQAFMPVEVNQCRDAFQAVNSNIKEPFFDEYGRIRLTLPDGKQTRAPVTVGFQHIVRLKHVAAKKAQVRGASSHGRSPYRYNLITGQPVGGRRNKGGQRLGEMELWALSANQANNVIQNVLTIKSDPSFQEAGLPQGQTFQAIKDHLLALGIELKNDKSGKAILGFISAETIRKQGREITDARMWNLGVESEFSCRNETCGYKYPRCVIATGKTQNGKRLLTLGDVLKDHGLNLSAKSSQNIPPLLPETGKSGLSGEVSVYLESVSPKRKVKRISLSYSRKVRSLHLTLTLSRNKYSAYKQIDKSDNEIPVNDLLGVSLSCPDHTVKSLKCVRQHPVLIPQKNGLCDPELFGNIDVSSWQSGTGGYVRLPKSPFADIDDRILKKHLLLQAMHEQLSSDDHCYLPILPLKYRFQRPALIGGSLSSHQDKIGSIYHQLIKLSGKTNRDQDIYRLIMRLSHLLSDRLFGKSGLIRRHGLGRRVDMSGRLVIVPDPTLDWDSCGVPTETLITFLGPRIIDEPDFLQGYMKANAVAGRLINEIFGPVIPQYEASAAIAQDVLDRAFWNNNIWPDKKRTEQHLRLAYEVLECYLLEHPETTVLLNRQPSLHRYSMMGFRPVPLPPEDGLVLKINPLVCKGFGADFDGDEMAIYMPLTDEEQADIEAMKPTKKWNLVSVADGEPLANFDQDFVSGHFYISLDAQYREKLKSIFPVASCPRCKELLERKPPWLKEKHGKDLISHLCGKHPDKISKITQQWMRLAFEAVTESGLSFGFLELEKIHEKLLPSLSQILDTSVAHSDPVALKKDTDTLGKKVLAELQTIIAPSNGDFLIDAHGFGFAALAFSGARGSKQTRQLVGGRGLLAPGDTGFAYSPEDFFIPQSLVAGMSPKAAFMAAMNARSSMVDKKLGTGRAGYLMRRLVLALWDWTVRAGDCGQTSSGRPLQSCNWRHKKYICSACYGRLPGYDVLPDKFPAGLIAAQSFGERGTQLSMQSFHTAERQLSIDDVVALLGGKDRTNHDKNWFDNMDKADDFVDRIKKESGYKTIDERHLRLIWLVIHLSEKNTLAGAWDSNLTPIAGLAGPNQKQVLQKNIESKSVENFTSPLVKVMTGLAPVNACKEDCYGQK